MIISFRHKFVFVAVPKTATHAFRVALRAHLSERDWEQCVLFERKFFPVKPLAQIGHGHITWHEVKPFLLPQMRAEYFKFCTVRNPYERFVSYCRFINRDNPKMPNDALGAMKRIIEDEKTRREILFRPQAEFVTDEDGELMVDYVCRFENLQADFDKVCEKLGLPAARLQRINSTDSENCRNVYDDELKDMVREFYQQDFETFGYE